MAVNAFNDVDTLELEEDGCNNATIKEHALVGKVLSNHAIQHLKVLAIMKKKSVELGQSHGMVKDPLKIGFTLNRASFDPINVSFKYQRIPKFCFSCGRLGHGEKEYCYDYARYTRAGQYGPWLRVSSIWIKLRSPNPNTNMIIKPKLHITDEISCEKKTLSSPNLGTGKSNSTKEGGVTREVTMVGSQLIPRTENYNSKQASLTRATITLF
ncbi:hypothetical protein GQ457_15G011350 [Hibiscus cannabinus]